MIDPGYLSLKAESLYLAGRTSEALAVITEAQAHAEISEVRVMRAALYTLRGVKEACLARGVWVNS